MNISLVGPVYPFRGGIAQHTTRLGLALAAADHNLQVLTFRKQYPGWLYPGRNDQDPSRNAVRIPAEAVLEPFAPGSWASSAGRIIASRPDLVILQYWTPFWAPAFFCLAGCLRKQDIPVVFVVHNVLPHERLPFDRLLAKLCLGRGNAFITHSPPETERLMAVMGSQILVSCLSHPLYDQYTKEDRNTARKKLGYDPDELLLLFFGLVRPYKGLDCLIQALGKLKQSGAVPKLLAAGEFWQNPDTFQKKIHRLGLDEQVRLDNRYIPDEEIPELFSAADLFVAPYIDGTQSGAVRLAMSFGLPILATEKALCEKERDYAPLKIVPGGDVAALAEGIRSWPDGWSPIGRKQPPFPNGWDELVKELERLRSWLV